MTAVHDVDIYGVDGTFLRTERRDPCGECLEGKCDRCDSCLYFTNPPWEKPVVPPTRPSPTQGSIGAVESLRGKK